jgi:hypothetical protein
MILHIEGLLEGKEFGRANRARIHGRFQTSKEGPVNRGRQRSARRCFKSENVAAWPDAAAVVASAGTSRARTEGCGKWARGSVSALPGKRTGRRPARWSGWPRGSRRESLLCVGNGSGKSSLSCDPRAALRRLLRSRSSSRRARSPSNNRIPRNARRHRSTPESRVRSPGEGSVPV